MITMQNSGVTKLMWKITCDTESGLSSFVEAPTIAAAKSAAETKWHPEGDDEEHELILRKLAELSTDRPVVTINWGGWYTFTLSSSTQT